MRIVFVTRQMTVVCLVWIAGIVLMGCGQTIGAQGERSSLYGISRSAAPLAIIVDASGSMGSGAGDSAHLSIATRPLESAVRRSVVPSTGSAQVDMLLGKFRSEAVGEVRAQTSKMAQTKREVIPFIRGLPDQTDFDLIVFSDRFTSFSPAPGPANEASKAAASTFLEQVQPSGGTIIGDPLEYALARGAITIYLITDGMPTDSPDRILQIVAEAARRGTVVHTVGIGQDVNVQFLQEIARRTGGNYVSGS